MPSTLQLFDTHAHLQFPQFDDDRAAAIGRMRQAGVGVMNVGTDLASSRAAVKLAEPHSDMWATVGLHPTDAAAGFDHDVYAELARHPRVVAIGECGLDYYHRPDSKSTIQDLRQRQEPVFRQQIELALAINKPLMIHCRDAYNDVLTILESYILNHKSALRGNVHFFAGDWTAAKRFLDLGFTLSFTGVITFTADYDVVVKQVPLDRVLLETDCPFVSPVPYRGRRNEPAWVTLVNERLAALKNLPPARTAAATRANTCRLFNLC